jgi:hypothetical protein
MEARTFPPVRIVVPTGGFARKALREDLRFSNRIVIPTDGRDLQEKAQKDLRLRKSLSSRPSGGTH